MKRNVVVAPYNLGSVRNKDQRLVCLSPDRYRFLSDFREAQRK
jgi:hypothetical protein